MPYSRICLKSRFKMIWSWKIHVAILIFFPFVWQRYILSNFNQPISTLSPNGIILNSSQLNPLLPITETTYIDLCGAFTDSSLPIGLFRLTALAFSLISACFLASLVDCFGDFFYSSLPIWLFWVTALGLSLISACLLSSLVDCFGAFADFSLFIGLFGWLLWRFRWFQLAYQLLWLTALALSLIPACFSPSTLTVTKACFL